MLETSTTTPFVWQEWLTVGGYLALLLVAVVGVFWSKR
jgi:hypothetical protein